MNGTDSLVPARWRVLSGSALKLIAVVSMLIDHIGACFFSKSALRLSLLPGVSVSLYEAMRTVGRLAFPLYAFLLVEGFVHTRDRKKYALRLLVFALLSELPWNLFHTAVWHYAKQNVMFTLLLGFLGCWVIERRRAQPARSTQWALALLGLLVLSIVLEADFGASGFGFILMLYLLRADALGKTVLGSCILSGRWRAGLAFIPINLYNGERGFIRGRFLGLLFYAFYPLHLLVLYLIRFNPFG